MAEKVLSVKKAGIVYHPRIAAARDLAPQMVKAVSDLGVSAWQCSSWEEERAGDLVESTDLVICLGGDGTILRVVRIIGPRQVPVLGVNFGRLGFMTELSAQEALAKVGTFLSGEGWVDERAMLQAEIVSGATPPFQALNDVVVTRGARCRLIQVKVTIDSGLLATYRSDGVIVASATGSTGYSLSAGGPVLHPQSKNMLLQPVAPHIARSNALVLEPDAVLELEAITHYQAILCVDGQVEVPLNTGDVIRVKRSSQVARLLRSRRHDSFYGELMTKFDRSERTR